jgi:hypothetical protein
MEAGCGGFIIFCKAKNLQPKAAMEGGFGKAKAEGFRPRKGNQNAARFGFRSLGLCPKLQQGFLEFRFAKLPRPIGEAIRPAQGIGAE